MSAIAELADYVRAHTERGACRCGKCLDAPDNPEEQQPEGPHTVSVFFFDVTTTGAPDAETFRSLISDAHDGHYASVDPFDGDEHNYIELGGWIGDQGLAMQFMALGKLLGLWDVFHPGLLPLPPELQQQMAGAGMVSQRAS